MPIIIKVGGSILSDSDEQLFDFKSAEKFKELLKPFIANGAKFILITGGGHLARKYKQLLQERNFPDYDQHYIGASSCTHNAVMLRAVMGELAEKDVLAFDSISKENNLNFVKPIQIAGGGPVGPSSDWDAVKLAIKSGAKSIISMKNINGVYSADPKKDPTAKQIKNLTWEEYLNIIGNPSDHTPGGHFPIDPIAARMAKENGISFKILNGEDFVQVKKAIEGGEFEGSEIK